MTTFSTLFNSESKMSLRKLCTEKLIFTFCFATDFKTEKFHQKKKTFIICMPKMDNSRSANRKISVPLIVRTFITSKSGAHF